MCRDEAQSHGEQASEALGRAREELRVAVGERDSLKDRAGKAEMEAKQLREEAAARADELAALRARLEQVCGVVGWGVRRIEWGRRLSEGVDEHASLGLDGLILSHKRLG